MNDNQLEYIETEIYKIPLFGKKVGLLNINRIMEELNQVVNLDDMFEKATVIHVTGTNGKGSVCKMLSTIYTEEGYKTGMFTSPHIDVITERIQLNNQNIEEDLFVEGYKAVKDIVYILNKEGLEPTFFEWIYGIALYCFAKVMPEVLIIEVGIGGKLDTTNSLPTKDLAIITPIGMDHQQILGDTIEEIAMEKAGIIREGIPVVVYNNQGVTEQVIDEYIARNKGKSYKVLPKRLKIHETGMEGIDFSLENKYYYYEKLRLPVLAKYQIENAAIALTGVHAINGKLPVKKENIYKGLSKFYWPGRFEKVKRNFFIDGAHNDIGAKILISSVKSTFHNYRTELLLGMKDGKNVDEVLKIIKESECFDHYYIVDLTIQKSVGKEYIANELDLDVNLVTLVPDLREFIENYNFEGEQVLIAAGSLFLVSEIRKIIIGGLK